MKKQKTNMNNDFAEDLFNPEEALEAEEPTVPPLEESTTQGDASRYTTNEPKETFQDGSVYTTKKKKENKTAPRASVAFLHNVGNPSLTQSQMLAKYKSSDITEADINTLISYTITKGKDVVSFKPVRLDPYELRLIFVIEYIISQRSEDPQIKSIIEETEMGIWENFASVHKFNLSEISRYMTGTIEESNNDNGDLIYIFKAGTARPTDIMKVFNALVGLGSKNHIQDVPKETGKYIDAEGKEKIKFEYSPLFAPLVQLWGFTPDKIDNIQKGINIVPKEVHLTLSRIFFDKLNTRYCYIDEILLGLFSRNPNSTLFPNLTSKLKELWVNAKIGYDKAEKDIFKKYNLKRKSRITEEIQEEIQKTKRERIVKQRTFEWLYRLTEDKDPDTKQSKYKFKNKIKKIVEELIQYGIITKETCIIEDRQEVIFVMNMEWGKILSSAERLDEYNKIPSEDTKS